MDNDTSSGHQGFGKELLFGCLSQVVGRDENMVTVSGYWLNPLTVTA